jgi:glycosyltransferase involved in cell wall biosynthesis
LKLKLLYAAGPGDVVGTFDHWLAGRDDPSEVSVTYSSQFFDACRDAGAQALVISSHLRADTRRSGAITVQNRPRRWPGAGGWRFHLEQLMFGLMLTWRAARFGADVAIIADAAHWYVLAMMRWTGVKVIPTLHCTFWPTGRRPTGLADRLLQRLNGWFWRRIPAATICLSPECERQVRELADRLSGPLIQARPRFRASTFAGIGPIRQGGALRVMYAGRIERAKGVFDLLEVARRIESSRPGAAVWEICGDGSALAELRIQSQAAGLGGVFLLLGKLDRPAMIQAYDRCQVVIVPTTSAFAEGFNKVCIEAALAGRAVVTSRYSHALDVLRDAAIEVDGDDVDGYEQAILRLLDSPGLLGSTAAAAAKVRGQFIDSPMGWGAVVADVISGLAAQGKVRTRA